MENKLDEVSPSLSRQDIDQILQGLNEASNSTRKPPFLDDKTGSLSSIKKDANKSSLSLQYEAEVSVIQAKLGSLEDIRIRLGLSRRKICQLLLVDPSAWTRWQKSKKAPFYIYRALQWYMALIDKEPAWHPQNSFNRIQSRSIENEVLVLTQEVAGLKKQLHVAQKRYILFSLLGLVFFVMGVLAGYGFN